MLHLIQRHTGVVLILAGLSAVVGGAFWCSCAPQLAAGGGLAAAAIPAWIVSLIGSQARELWCGTAIAGYVLISAGIVTLVETGRSRRPWQH
jgi:hypothetical protein